MPVTVDTPRLVLVAGGSGPSGSAPGDVATPPGGAATPGSTSPAVAPPRARPKFQVKNVLVGLLSLVVLAVLADYVGAPSRIAIGVHASTAAGGSPRGAPPGSGDEVIYGKATGAGGQGLGGLEIGIVANHARPLAFLTTGASGVFRQRVFLPAGSYTVVASTRSASSRIAPALADLSIEPGGHYRIDVSEHQQAALLWFPSSL